MDTMITKQEIIEVYKTILERETSNHTIFITVLMGITVIILGATWWWNKTGANSFIKLSVREEFEKQNDSLSSLIDGKIETAIKKELTAIEDKFKGLELDLYRSFAYSLDTENFFSHSTLYWSNSIEKAIELDEGELLRAFAETILTNIQKLETKEIHQVDKVTEVIKMLPNTLAKERQSILDILKDCKNI